MITRQLKFTPFTSTSIPRWQTPGFSYTFYTSRTVFVPTGRQSSEEADKVQIGWYLHQQICRSYE